MFRLILVFLFALWKSATCPGVFTLKGGNGYYYGEISIPYDVTNLWSTTAYQIPRYRYTFQVQNAPRNPSNNYFYEPNNHNKVTNVPYIPPTSSNEFTWPSTPTPTTTRRPRSVEGSCGVANDIQTLIAKGEKTKDNEYPWLVALFQNIQYSYQFLCTATLISSKHVVTAAHCVRFYKAALFDKEDILLVLGRTDIFHWASTGALIRTALDVIPHPNYQQDSGNYDIVVIKMNQEVFFKPSVRPICLWTGDSNLKTITGLQGIVSGWGKTKEAGEEVTVLRKVAMPVVSQETCLRSHSGFKNLTSDITFCAGNRDGSGPCNGDSGAGFMMWKNGKWYLRGVVSTAIKTQDLSCDLDEYVVFADAAKLNSWIKSVMK